MSQPFEIEVVGSAREKGGLTDLYVRVGMNRIGPLSDDEAIALAVALREQTAHRPLPHPNGGGLVDQTATVAATAFVGPRARVRQQAQVLNTARIEDEADVGGTSIVSDNARVYGNARVTGASRIRHQAQVFGFALVHDGLVLDWGIVRGHATVTEGGCVWASGRVLEHAVVRDSATVGSWSVVGGNAVVRDLAVVDGGLRVAGRAKIGYVRVATQDIVRSIGGDPDRLQILLGSMRTAPWSDGLQTDLLPHQVDVIDPTAPEVPLVAELLDRIDQDASVLGKGWFPLSRAVLTLAGQQGTLLAKHYGPWLAAALIVFRATGVPPKDFHLLGLALEANTRTPRTLRGFLERDARNRAIAEGDQKG